MDARTQKNHFERENKIDLFEVIQTEPHFFLLTQEGSTARSDLHEPSKVFSLLAITCKSKRHVKRPQTSYQN